jgi:hypothetical protein
VDAITAATLVIAASGVAVVGGTIYLALATVGLGRATVSMVQEAYRARLDESAPRAHVGTIALPKPPAPPEPAAGGGFRSERTR